MWRSLVVVAAVALLAAGCGGGGGGEAAPTDTGPTTTEPAATVAVRAYFLREGKVWPARRELEETEVPGLAILATASAALEELLAGPTAREQADLGFETAIPAGTELAQLEIEARQATLSTSVELPHEAMAQVVYTLTQLPGVESVGIGGETFTRADFEDVTPAILVESPLAFEEVANPLRATGTANAFEATFQYELADTDGRIVDSGFVTATSGTGTRGTFDFTTGRYEVPFDGVGALFVFEVSAEDGSRINLVEIPVRMRR